MNQEQRQNFYYTIWIMIFGIALGLGSSVLDLVHIPILKISAQTPFAILLLTLNKLILLRKYSATWMYLVVGIISIFTFTFGPPSPLAVLAVFAGLAFDVGTRLKTSSLTLIDLLIGHFASTIAGFSITWVIFRVHMPDLAPTLIGIFLFGAVAHFGISIVVSIFLYNAYKPGKANSVTASIQRQIGSL